MGYFAEGLSHMSPIMAKQVISECLSLGRTTVLQGEIHVADNYGGLLLENATLLAKHWPLSALEPFDALDTPRRHP